MVEISVESRNRISPRQVGGEVRWSRVASSGRRRYSPGSAGTSDSASWAAQAGWVKSPVPTTVTPLRAAHQARLGISQSLLQAREYREWMCRSVWNTSSDPAMRYRQAQASRPTAKPGREPDPGLPVLAATPLSRERLKAGGQGRAPGLHESQCQEDCHGNELQHDRRPACS